MKRLLILLGCFLVWGAPAQAGVVLGQDDDGGASWVTSLGGNISKVPAGEHFFTVQLDDVSTQSTSYVVIPFGNARLKQIDTVNHATFDGTSPAVQVLIGTGADNQFTPVTNETLVMHGSTVGTVRSMSFSESGKGYTVDIDEDDVIAINTDGASSNTARITITITVH